MDNLFAIGVGLGLRTLLDTVTNHNHRLNGSLVGLWEGAVLRHFIAKYPASVDPYVAFGFRLLVDLLWTTSWTRLFITILWSFMGMLLSDVFVDLFADRRFRRFTRDVRHTVIYPLLRLFSRSGSRSSSGAVGGGSNTSNRSATSRAQYYQLPPSSSGGSTARSPPLQPRSPTETSNPPFRPVATPAPPRRSALRVPGSFSDRGMSETDTTASGGSGSRAPSIGPSRSNLSVTWSDSSHTPSATSPSQEGARPTTRIPSRPLSSELRGHVPEPSRTPVPEPSRTPVPIVVPPVLRTPGPGPPHTATPPPRPLTPDLEYAPIPAFTPGPAFNPVLEPSFPIRPVLSDDERSVNSDLRGRSSGLTTPDKERPRINVFSPEPVKSGLTTPADRPSTPHNSLPPVTVLDEAATQVSGSDTNYIPIPIRLYERTPDPEDQAQTRAALLHPELIPDINTPQPSPGLIPPAEYLHDINPTPTRSEPPMRMPRPQPDFHSDLARTSTTAPPPYEYPLGEGGGGAADRIERVDSEGTPAASVISNVDDRSHLLRRAESLRSIADEADKRRTELNRELQDARRSRDHWSAFRLKHEMDRAAHDARELHAKAARRFYQAHNMKPQPQTIDVHRLKVPEAIEKVEQALYDSIVTGTPELRIITGQGKHSKNKIPALKLAIIGAMADQHIDAIPDATNPGVLLIYPPANRNATEGPSTSS
ncbi:hypothetical protein C2E23DRAFT_891524 [Lenzites betulinus]|nr:hypothetical protein C2E23DRAFT_891524 [Lenzites betulinus]